MTNPSADNSSRLSALKNVGKRRVKGEEEGEDFDLDVSGAAPLETPQNVPVPDMGGELSSQSYDVRANTVYRPEQMQQDFSDTMGDNPMKKLGRALAMNLNNPPQQEPPVTPQAPPIETQQVEQQEGLPPVSASQQVAAEEARPGFVGDVKNIFSRLGSAFNVSENFKAHRATPEAQKNAAENQKIKDSGDYLGAYLNSGRTIAQGLSGAPAQAAEVLNKNFENTQRLTNNPEIAPPPLPQQETPIEQEQDRERFMAEIDEAQKSPEGAAVYGAADEIANSPELAAEFNEIVGMDINNPEVRELMKTYEAILTGQDERLAGSEQTNTEQIARIQERIASNQATDADKFYVGLALTLPLIIGGIFGKEAGLGALGGAAKGFADIQGGRQKRIAEDEELLASSNKDRAALQTKRGELDIAKLGKAATVKGMLPANPKEFIKGKREATWKDPRTGQTKKGVEIKPGFIAQPQYITSKEDLHLMEKAAEDLNPMKTFTHELSDLSDDLVEISSQLKDKDAFTQLLVSLAEGKSPRGSLSKLTQDVTFNGRKQNAGILLENKIGLLKNAYAQAKKLGQLDRALQDHFDKILVNPTNSLASPKDLIDQVLGIKELTQKSLIKQAEGRGFAGDFLEDEFRQKNRKTNTKLNKKEEMKESDALLGV